MSAWQQRNIDVQELGTKVTVPDNDVAKCMYYLSCVFGVLEHDESNIRRYTDYFNYHRLSVDDVQIVYKLCLTFSPDEFEDKLFFESDALCGSFGNNFYQINEVRNRLGVVGSIIIAGRTRRVTKIMTYKMSWMQKNYLGPMSRLADRLNPERQLLRALQDNDCTIS